MQHKSLLSSQLRVRLQAVRLVFRPGRFGPNAPIHIIDPLEQDEFGQDDRKQCFLMGKKGRCTNG